MHPNTQFRGNRIPVGLVDLIPTSRYVTTVREKSQPQRPRPGAREKLLEASFVLIREKGYSATSGVDLIRASLCEEALRLGRILAELEAHDGQAKEAQA